MILQRTVSYSILAIMSFALFLLAMSSVASAEQHKMITNPHASGGILAGTVTDIINVPSYTYAEVDTGKKKVWVAGPVTPLKKGDKVSFSTGMPMENFHSKTMKRDFSVVYFVDRFLIKGHTMTGEPTNMPSPHAQVTKPPAAKAIEGIKKLGDGYSISEIHADKKKLEGKTIRVRGKVTKFTLGVMGKNWIHIRDSSTLDDLTITRKDTATVDDVVVVEGKLELNKDFSYGYVYPVIIMDATISR